MNEMYAKNSIRMKLMSRITRATAFLIFSAVRVI